MQMVQLTRVGLFVGVQPSNTVDLPLGRQTGLGEIERMPFIVQDGVQAVFRFVDILIGLPKQADAVNLPLKIVWVVFARLVNPLVKSRRVLWEAVFLMGGEKDGDQARIRLETLLVLHNLIHFRGNDFDGFRKASILVCCFGLLEQS